MRQIFTKIFLAILFFSSITTKAQWAPTNGPTGGGMEDMASIGSQLFITTHGGGVYKSSDNGANWVQINNGLLNIVDWGIASKGTDLYVGTNGSGVFKSSDQGTTWNSLGAGIDYPVDHIAFNGTVLFASTSEGLYRSTNDGATWEKCYSASTVGPLAVMNGEVYLGAGDNMLKSSDNGDTWILINNGVNASFYDIAIDGNKIYIGTSNGMYVSSDYGNSWQKKFNSSTLKLDVKGSEMYCNTWNGLQRSLDNGMTWTSINTNMVALIKIINSSVFAGTYGDLQRSLDFGTTWTPAMNGIACVDMHFIFPYGGTLYAGSYQGLHKSTDNGVTWTFVGFNRSSVSGMVSLGTDLILGTDLGPYISKDNGVTWNLSSAGFGSPNPNITGIWVSGTTLYAAVYNQIFVSTDGGASWSSISNGLPSGGISSFTSKNNILYAATADGLYKSTDNGANWNVDATIQNYVNGIAITSNSTNVFVLVINGIYVSADDGATWNFTPDIAGYGAGSVQAFGSKVYLGLYGVVEESLDNGQTWSLLDTGLPQRLVKCVFPVPGRLLGGLDLYSIWSLPDTSIVQQPTAMKTCDGSNAVFSIKARSPQYYKWQQSTDGGVTWNVLNDGGIYSGCTTNTLTLTGVGMTNNGYKYKCSITAGLSSTVVSLTVNPKASTTKSRTICQGSFIQVGTNYYNNSGVYTNVLKTINGCDSVAVDTLIVIPNTFVNVNISASSTDSVCTGSPITLVAYGSNQGAKPVYQWYRNSMPVGKNSDTYKDSSFSDNDKIYVTLIGSEACSVPSIAISNSIYLKISQCIPGILADINPATCKGRADGSIILSGTGGRPPYNFSWTTGDTAHVKTNISSGLYAVTISDSYQRSSSRSITLPDLIRIKANISVSASTNGKNGQATAVAYNGQAPYTYSWNTSPVQNNATATGLNGSTYYVLIVDNVGCILDTAVKVPGVTGLMDISKSARITLSPNPFNSNATVTYEVSPSVKAAVFNIYDVQGRFVRSYSLDKTQTTLNIDGSELQNGVYFYNLELDKVPTERKKMVVIR